MIHQGGNFGIRVYRDEPGRELIAVHDVDDPCVVFRLFDTEREKLLEQNSHLHAVGRGQRIELVGVFADGQFLVVGRARNRAVDAGKASAGFGFMFPDFGRRIGVRHCASPELRGWANKDMSALEKKGGARETVIVPSGCTGGKGGAHLCPQDKNKPPGQGRGGSSLLRL